MPKIVTVIGAGLAGVEAAWQCARRGIPVRLVEMRPGRMTPAHETSLFGELVCSNSLKSRREGTAPALLKEEMRALSSLTLAAAGETAVPGGGALAVDRLAFARRVTDAVRSQAGLAVEIEEAEAVPAEPAVIASGPLTSPALAAALAGALGRENLYFFDALAPVISSSSIDREKTYESNRYGKDGGNYVNCPLTKEEYAAFADELARAKTAPLRDFERGLFFEACLPIEELAKRGGDTLRFGPMKPVGLVDGRSGKMPYAVAQLRYEDDAGAFLGMVGFQTRLTQPEQRRVFGMIPALARAEYLRYGAAHRNTYVCSPLVLEPTLQVRGYAGVFMAGQLTGVEGYMESAATGILAGVNVARWAVGAAPVYPPRETAIGALVRYITVSAAAAFGPMNFNFGLLPPVTPSSTTGRRDRNEALIAVARERFRDWARALEG